MAVAFDGFSIRAYAAKMRNADVCWPFKEESEDLPPMDVPKFRWWSNELAEIRRRHTNDAAAPSESCRSPAKAKSRPTKKRSIAEIFAIAPQIDPVDHEIYIDEVDFGADRVRISDSGDYLSELRNEIKKKKKVNSNSFAVSIEKRNENKKRFINNKKKKKKKRSLDHHGSIIAIEKSPQKSKHQNHASFAKRVKRFAMEILDSESAPGKKISENPPSTKENQKADQTPIVITDDDEESTPPPVRSILKNIHSSCEPNTPTDNVNHRCGDDEIPSDTQSLEKHVKFSGEADIIVHDIGSSSLSDCLAASSQEDPEVVAMEVDGSVDEIEIEPVIIELPSSPVHPVVVQDQNLSPLPEKIAGSYYDKKLQMLDENCPSVLPGFASRLFSTVATYQIPGSKSARLSNHVQDPIYTVEEVNPLDCTRGLVEPVTLIPASNDETESHRIQSQLHHDEKASNPMKRMCRLFEPVSLIPASVDEHLASCIRPDRRPHPKDLIGGSNSLPQQQAMVSRKKSLNKDFVGLPLDSQSLAIQSNPRPVIGPSSGLFHAQSHTQQKGTGDSLGTRNDQDGVYVVQNHARESQSFHMPARLGITSSTSWESSGRAADSNNNGNNIQQIDFERSNLNLRPLDADPNPRIICFDGTRPPMHGHPKDNSGNKLSLSACQPTVRLMGKDVPIGREKVQRSDGGKGNVWTDKQIIIEDRNSEEDSPVVSAVAPNFREWIPVEKQSRAQQVNSDNMSTRSRFAVKPVLQQNSNHGFPRLPASSAPRFRDFFVSEAEPVHQLLPHHQIRDPYSNIQWRPAGLTHGLNFSNNSNNAAQLPSWLVQAKQQGKTQMNLSHQHHQVQPQQISSRTNIVNTPSLYSSPPNPLWGLVSNYPNANAAQVSKPSSNASYVNRVKPTEKVNLKPLGINDIYPWKRTTTTTNTSNKNLAAVKPSADLTKPTRPVIINLERDRTATMRSSGTVLVNQGLESDVVFPDHQTIPFIPPAGRVTHQDSRNNATNIYRF